MPSAAFAKRSYTQTDTGAWAADSPGINIALEKNGILTELEMTAEITPSATLDGANQPDGLFRVFQNTTIRGGTGGTYVTLPAEDTCPGGILLHYLNRLDYRMAGHPLALITAPRRTYTPITYVYHFGSRPRTPWGYPNHHDMSAFIPANKETGNLSYIIVTSSNDVMDDTITISSGTYRFTLYIIQGTEGDIQEEIAAQGVRYPAAAPHGMIPQWQAENYPHTGTFSDYAYSRDVPLGGWLKRISILEKDATSDRSLRAADEVTGVALELSGLSNNLIRQFGDGFFNRLDFGSNSQADDAAPDFQAHAPHGMYFMDLRPYMGGWSDYGLNLGAPLQAGNLKLKFTISTYASGDASLLLYERCIANPMTSFM